MQFNQYAEPNIASRAASQQQLSADTVKWEWSSCRQSDK